MSPENKMNKQQESCKLMLVENELFCVVTGLCPVQTARFGQRLLVRQGLICAEQQADTGAFA